MRKTLFFLVFPIFVFSSETPLENLERRTQDFVLGTKKIEIPGHPFAFNPGIIRWQGRLLLSFRVIPDPSHPFDSEIGVVWLNDELETSSPPQILMFRDEFSSAPSRAEDARLITIGEKLYIVYDDNCDFQISKAGFRMYIAEIQYDGEYFVPFDIECLKDFEGESPQRREKSWTPFNYQESLLLIYSIDPHLIFFPRLDGTGICDTLYSTRNPLAWDWGELRGGTPALIVNGQYLSFFHSSMKMATVHSNGKNFTHYFMGAYTFSLEPPFAITAMSPEPIIGENFYTGIHYKPYWKPIVCVFPCGYVFDENYIWIAYGRDDHECWIVKLDKKRLLDGLLFL